MFIGEAPGADEDREGVPFVGRAGLIAVFVSNDSVSLSCVGHLPGHGSLRGQHGRRMMGRRGSAFQGLKRGPRAAAN